MTDTSPQHQNGVAHKFRGCDSINQYDVLEKLGEGTFGEVHKARSRKTGAVVALKKILLHNEKDGFPVTAIREIKLLKMLSHVNVLKLTEMAVERPKGKERKKAIMYMVTPYMDHDLSGLLENPDVTLSEPQIKCYMLQLLEGLRYIHDSHILHRDMKAANLLISNKGILQIADFGLARHYDEPVPQKGRGGGEARREYTTLVVTRWYRPPELLLQLRRYTTAIDLWGVGCVFGEMFKRSPILAGKSDLNQAHLIFEMVGSPTEENMPGWSSLPGFEGVTSFEPKTGNLAQQFRQQGSAVISFLSEFLKLDWRKRISAIDALDHSYFRNDPLPAKPHELPTYEDSHELDRRKFRGQKAAPPPAPAGGTVGMGPNGEWAGGPSQQNGGAYASGPPSRDYRGGSWGPSAGPPGHVQARGGYDTRGPPPAQHDRGNGQHYDQRRPPALQGAPPHRPAWQQQQQQPRHENPPQQPRHEIPPRPPPTQHGRPLDPVPNGRNPSSNRDTYVPSYNNSTASHRAPPREDRRSSRDDRDHDRPDYRDRDRDASAAYPRERERHSADRRPPYGDRSSTYTDRSNGASYGERSAGHDDHGRGAPQYGDRDRRRTRSRSPGRDRPRERDRDKDRDGYRR